MKASKGARKGKPAAKRAVQDLARPDAAPDPAGLTRVAGGAAPVPAV